MTSEQLHVSATLTSKSNLFAIVVTKFYDMHDCLLPGMTQLIAHN